MKAIETYYRLRKSGNGHAVEVQLSYIKSDGFRDKYRQSTGLRIPATEWDVERREPTAKFVHGHPEWYQKYREFQAAIQDIIVQVEKDEGILSKQALKKYFEVRFQRKVTSLTNESISSKPRYLDDFITWFIEGESVRPESKRKAYRTHQQYMKIYNRLKRYYEDTERRILLETVSMEDVDKFSAWFEKQRKSDGQSYAQNTLADNEKWVIALLNKAMGSRLNLPLWNPKESLGRIPRVESDNIHFDLLDLQKLMEYAPENSIESKTQTWGVITFCTGLRVSDWTRFYELLSGKDQPRIGEEVSSILTDFGTNKYVQLRPQKTSRNSSGLVAGIPVLKPIEDIILRNGLLAPITGQKFNVTLKDVAEKAGIDETYTFRRILGGEKESQTKGPKGRFASSKSFGRSSFITLLHDFVPKPVHSKVTGHSVSSSDAFDTYVRDLHLKKNAARFLGHLKVAQDNGEFDFAERNGEQIPIYIKLV